MRAFRSLLNRSAFCTVAAVAVLAVVAAPVLAYTEISRTGNIGTYQLNDNPSPGAVCHYGTNGRIQSFDVYTPTIWSRDKTSGRDKQRVGWQVIIKRAPYHQPLKTLHKAANQKADAWDDQSAFFATKSVHPTFPSENPGDASYLVYERLTWYKADGSVAGQVDARVDWYQEDNGTTQHNLSSCPNHFV